MKSDRPKKNKKKNKKNKQPIKVVKTSLKSIIKNKENINPINDVVFEVNKIVRHTYNFLKLYYISKFNNNEKVIINNKLINTIMKILCEKDPRGKPKKGDTKKLFDELQIFFDNNYKFLMADSKLSYTHMNTILDYEAISVVTCFSNHIIAHFTDFLMRYINVMTKKDETLKKFKNLKEGFKFIKEFNHNLWVLKKDITANEDNCIEEYLEIKNKIRNVILEDLVLTKNFCDKVEDDPFKFLPSMIRMSLEIESNGQKTFTCFPLRTSIIPKYIRLDTTTLVHILSENKAKYLTEGYLKENKDLIWDDNFKTTKKVFKKKGYRFNNQICTDGLACSLMFVRDDLYGLKVKSSKKTKREFIYLDELSDKEKKLYSSLDLVGIDPGKTNLIYATNGKTKFKVDSEKGVKSKVEYFRYTQNQRKTEIKTNKYREDIKNDKLQIVENSNNRTFKNYEDDLSKYNSKSCKYEKVEEYVLVKNNINKRLEKYYRSEIHRKYKWYSFINKQKSESKMINNFKKKFGDESKTMICMGDYEEKRCMKYNEPTKGKSIRKLFKNAGYKLYLINEFRTSKMSYINGDELSIFRKRAYNIINKEGKEEEGIKMVRGLLRSKNVNRNKQQGTILISRDLNGAMNILKKAQCIIMKKEIPTYLKRK